MTDNGGIIYPHSFYKLDLGEWIHLDGGQRVKWPKVLVYKNGTQTGSPSAGLLLIVAHTEKISKDTWWSWY